MSKCAPPISHVVAGWIGASILFTATTSLAATVSIYKVIDGDGHVTYQNVPPGPEAERVERRAFDLEANAMNFTRPRAVGAGPVGGGNANNNNDVITRLANELSLRAGGTGTGISVTRGSGSVVFSDQSSTGFGVLGGGEVSGIVTPSGNLVGADNPNIDSTAAGVNTTSGTGFNAGASTGGGTGINAGGGTGINAGGGTGINAGGGTGMGGGQGTGPAITNPSTDGATFTGGNQTFTGSNQTFTGNAPTFTGNSPTFTSNSATFSSNTGTLGPATPGIGAGTVGATGGFNSNGGNGAATGAGVNTGTNAGTAAGSSAGAQTGVAPGTNPFAGSNSIAPRGGAGR